jgi:Lrp/AsnC family transcriptional regulator
MDCCVLREQRFEWCTIGAQWPSIVQESSIVDELDRKIVQLLQRDGSLSARELGDQVGLTPTPCWRRVRALEDDGVIVGRVALVDPAAVNLDVTALVNIRTNNHGVGWIDDFKAAIDTFPEIIEAYRTSGDIDYTLKVMVPSITAYDEFYKRLIAAVDLYDVRTIFVMEELKRTTALPLDYIT